jgi:urea transporter
MLTAGFSALSVSLFRFGAVISELLATCLAPLLMKQIGDIRAGLWSINWQLISLAGAVFAFASFQDQPKVAGPVLTGGIVMSRVGLWSFDLAVQNIIQEVC